MPRFRLLPILGLLLGGVACSASSESVDDGDEAVTNVRVSTIKDQSTDNCWTYASMGWAESLVLTAGGPQLELSESYVTYWHWYEQITAGQVTGAKVEEGGSWGEAADLSLKYGLMESKDFEAADATTELSAAQDTALKAVNAALKDGALKDATARQDRKLVRKILDDAWALPQAMRDALDATFGADVSKTLDQGAVIADGAKIKDAKSLPAKLKNPTSNAFDMVTLADAMGTHKDEWDQDHRDGTYAWNDTEYPKTATARRAFLKRVQRALADGQPVVLNWYVDFNALNAQGQFLAPPTKPGSQGGHVVIITDYQVENVPGFGTLPAGTVETRPDALQAALSDQAKVTFLRIKNSWGTDYHPLAAPAPKGDHDLYLKYLNGPIKECDMDDNDKPKLATCAPAIPFESVVLPAGY